MPIFNSGIRRVHRAAALSVLALALAAPAAFLAHGSSRRHSQQPPAPALQPVPDPHGRDKGRLDLLRDEATLGDEWANGELVRALLDRYDQRGSSDDLYEALIWIDTQWEHTGTAEQADRVVAKYCDQRIVRWHWLCSPGE
ncbi:hypothetical protein [Variovorax sp. OV329]|uniref:hypothetical protein n=1 Tax=Variovorax sp. OV329 TaxID=1882825 RepID=UPI0008E0A405|nr:hypothetical protein [Variovorax sp. OV329]SFN39881.1 hypothetical protein SAMN05444747_12457 [Variovorax sp. OV329]